MKRSSLLVCGVVCLSLSLSMHDARALEVRGPGDDQGTLAERAEKLKKEGWNQIAAGVFQRNKGGKKRETLALGNEGAAWVRQDLEARLEFLSAEYAARPTPELWQVLTDLQRLQTSLGPIASVTARSSSQELEADPLGVGCDVTYGSHADAYSLNPGQGVGATANAYYTHNCGISGDTYAYVYAQATNGTTTTTYTQSDPDSGTSISSSAAASLSGGEPCYSEAYSWVRFTGSSSFLLTASDSEDYCPVPSLSASVSVSPSSVALTGYNCQWITWTASPSGGAPGYSYYWTTTGTTGSSVSEYVCGYNYWDYYSITHTVTVTDSASQTASASGTAYVSTEPSNNCPNWLIDCPIQPIEP